MATVVESKAFRVFLVSSNANSFGLRGMLLVAADGEAWEVGANHLYVKERGSTVHVPCPCGYGRSFSELGYEIPTQLPVAPKAIVDKVWA